MHVIALKRRRRVHEIRDTEGEEEHCCYKGVSGHKGGMLLHEGGDEFDIGDTRDDAEKERNDYARCVTQRVKRSTVITRV
jgi:hypothetical protein